MVAPTDNYISRLVSIVTGRRMTMSTCGTCPVTVHHLQYPPALRSLAAVDVLA